MSIVARANPPKGVHYIMACWNVEQLPEKTTVLYVNLRTGEKVPCGATDAETPMKMILDWLAEEAAPGDAVYVNGEPVFQKLVAVTDAAPPTNKQYARGASA